MKRLGVFLLPPGWDSSPSQVYLHRTSNNSRSTDNVRSKITFVSTNLSFTLVRKNLEFQDLIVKGSILLMFVKKEGKKADT